MVVNTFRNTLRVLFLIYRSRTCHSLWRWSDLTSGIFKFNISCIDCWHPSDQSSFPPKKRAPRLQEQLFLSSSPFHLQQTCPMNTYMAINVQMKTLWSECFPTSGLSSEIWHCFFFFFLHFLCWVIRTKKKKKNQTSFQSGCNTTYGQKVQKRVSLVNKLPFFFLFF